MARYRTLDSVARDICAVNLGDANNNNAARVMLAIRRVLDEFQYHIPFFIRSETFTISDNYTVTLPDNVIDVLKVGTIDTQSGMLKIMGRHDKLRRNGDDAVACTCNNCAANANTTTIQNSASPSTPCDACTFNNVLFRNGLLGEAYGYRLPEFPNGRFRYNDEAHRIEFGTGVDVYAGAEVLVEYRCSMEGEDYNMIPSEMVNCIGFRVAQILNIQTRPGVAQMNLQEFQRSWKMLKRAYQTWSAEDFVAAIKGQARSSPKF